ncbi:hypothetical protein CEXT_583831, partial [Caerostris extrusa]
MQMVLREEDGRDKLLLKGLLDRDIEFPNHDNLIQNPISNRVCAVNSHDKLARHFVSRLRRK